MDGLSGDTHSRGFFPWTSMILRSARDILESLELISWAWMGAGWRATFVFRFGYWREEIRARVSYATLRDRQRGGMRWTIGGRWREKRSNGRDNPSKPVPPSNRSKTNSVTLNWTKQRNFSLVSFTRDIVTFVRPIESSPVPRTRGTTFLNVSIG